MNQAVKTLFDFSQDLTTHLHNLPLLVVILVGVIAVVATVALRTRGPGNHVALFTISCAPLAAGIVGFIRGRQNAQRMIEAFQARNGSADEIAFMAEWSRFLYRDPLAAGVMLAVIAGAIAYWRLRTEIRR